MAEQRHPKPGEPTGLLGWLRKWLEKRLSAGPDDRARIRAWNRQVERFLDRGQLVWALEHAEQTHAHALALGCADPVTWESRELLGACLYALGRAAEALIHQNAVLEGRRSAADDGDCFVWTTMNNAAVSLLALDRAQEGLPLLENAAQSMAMCAALEPDDPRALEPDDPRVVGVRANLADCLSQLGRAEDALAALDAALSDLESNDMPLPRTAYDYHVADKRLRSGGLSVDPKSIGERIRREGNERKAPGIVITTGGSLRVIGPFAMLEGSISKSLADGVGFPESWRDERAVTLKACKALCLMRANRPAEALPLYREVLYHSERCRGNEHPQTPLRRNQYGDCLMRLGEWKQALSYLSTALVEQRMLLGDDHPSSVEIWVNHATVLEQLGRLDEAVADWRCIASALRANLRPGGVWLKNLEATWRAMDRQARAGYLADWPVLFEGLSDTVIESVDLLDADQWHVARESVAGFFSTYLELTLDLDRADLVPAALAGAQGRKLAALVREELDLRAEKEGDESDAAKYRKLREKLRRLQLGIDGSRGGGQASHEDAWTRLIPGAEDASTGYREYQVALEEFREVRRKLAKENPRLLSTGYNFKPTLATLREKFAPDAALVLLLTRPDETDAVMVTAVVIRATAAAIVPLGVWGKRVKAEESGPPTARTRFGRLARRGVIRAGICGEATDEETDSDGAMNDGQVDWHVDPGEPWEDVFGKRLWGPLTGHLDAASTVHFITQGEIHGLPYDSGCPESVRVAVYPGLVFFDRLCRSGTDRDFAAEGKMVCRAYGAEETPCPIPLVHAERSALGALWTSGVGESLDACDPLPRCWHLAGHGHIDRQHPTLAGVLLGPEPQDILNFHQILAFPQVPPLVFLSACVVGQTWEDALEGEPLGLVGALLLRDARFVVGAVESVDDLLMWILVTLFYQAWCKFGKAPAQALAEAKQRMVSGDWYPDTVNVLRSCPSYRRYCKERIEQALQDDPDDSTLIQRCFWCPELAELLPRPLKDDIIRADYIMRDGSGLKPDDWRRLVNKPALAAEVTAIRARLADGPNRAAEVDRLVEALSPESIQKRRKYLNREGDPVLAVRGFGWGWSGTSGGD